MSNRRFLTSLGILNPASLGGIPVAAQSAPGSFEIRGNVDLGDANTATMICFYPARDGKANTAKAAPFKRKMGSN